MIDAKDILTKNSAGYQFTDSDVQNRFSGKLSKDHKDHNDTYILVQYVLHLDKADYDLSETSESFTTFKNVSFRTELFME